MQKLLTVLVVTSMMSITSTFAAELPGTATGTNSPVTESQEDTMDAPSTVEPTPELNAAPVNTVAPSMGSSLGEYKAVACSTNPAFTTNSCNQCFEGGSVKVGGELTGLFDNWTNNTTNILLAYQNEQKLPEMVSFGSTWSHTPSDLSKFWKNSSDVTWVAVAGNNNRMNYILPPGQKVRFLEAEMGARYVLEKSDKKNGEMVGILKFPIVSHAVAAANGSEGAASAHNECVSYTLAASDMVPPTPVTPEPTPVTPPTPGEVTQTATGPAETLILILAAFFIAFGMMFSLRKRN